LVYAFPKGYDARYWKALADANTVIAAFEDVVFDGAATRAHALTPLTRLDDRPALGGRGALKRAPMPLGLSRRHGSAAAPK
jgi:hypothetical protein